MSYLAAIPLLFIAGMVWRAGERATDWLIWSHADRITSRIWEPIDCE